MNFINKFSKRKLFFALVLSITFFLLFDGFFYWKIYIRLDPNSPQTYYKIFDKNEILDGTEDNADIVKEKLDKRLSQYRKVFIQMAGTNDDKKLRALFMMNFVHMYGYYGKRNLKEKTLNDLLRGSEYYQCEANTTFLAMLLDKTGYEFRTVVIANRTHGFVEVKFDDNWQILDPTVNLWINKSTEELLSKSERVNKQFFVKASDQSNQKAYEGVAYVVNIQDMMLKLGSGYTPKIDQYDFVNLSDYKY